MPWRLLLCAVAIAVISHPPRAAAQAGTLTFAVFTDLGTVHVLGSSGYGNVYATNSGTTPVQITSAALTGAPEIVMIQPPALPVTLAPGQLTVWNFRFFPNGVGQRSAVFTLNSNATGSPHTFTLTAEAIDVPLGPWPWQLVARPLGTRDVSGITVDPDNENVWYVSSQSGLYITRNGGSSWEYPLSGIIDRAAFAIDPRNHNRLYAGFATHCRLGVCAPHLYTSADKGVSWTFLRRFQTLGNGSLTSLAVDPADSTVYVPYNIDETGDWHNPGIYLSHDVGQTWEFHSFGVVDDQFIAWDIEQDPVTRVLYVGIEVGDHQAPAPYDPPFFRSLDKGITWQEVSGGGLNWHAIKIQVDRQNHDVYAVLEGPGVYRSSDQGLTWNALFTPFWLEFLLDPANRNRMYGGAQIQPLPTAGGAFVSMDAGATFEHIGLRHLTIASLALNSSGTKLYAAANGAGVFVSPVVDPILPAAFQKQSPPHGVSGLSATPVLIWSPSARATSYEFCYDPIDNDACDGGWTSAGTNTSAMLNLSPGTTFFWQVRARNDAGTTDASLGWWRFTRGAAFPDDPLVPGVTTIRSTHISELRTRIDTLRSRYNLPVVVWTDPSIAGVSIRAAHVVELRAALAAVYLAAGMTPPPYTDATLVAGVTVIRAAHISELRAAVVAIE